MPAHMHQDKQINKINEKQIQVERLEECILGDGGGRGGLVVVTTLELGRF